MALTYLGSAAALQRGVELAEPGIGVKRFEVHYFPEVDEFHQNNLGETDGAVISTSPSRDITIEGEVTGTTGHMSDVFTSAITIIANDLTTFGGAGGVYMKKATEKQERAAWREVTLEFKARPSLA